jgi:hypothetical protein
MEETPRQIQGDSPTEKTRIGENPKANPVRQPYKENKKLRKF